MTTALNSSQLRQTAPPRFVLPNEGLFISNNMTYDQERYIIFISKILRFRPIKEAFVLLNRQHPNQRLNHYPNIRFGRSDNAIWFSECDSDGHLISIEPCAIIFFKTQISL